MSDNKENVLKCTVYSYFGCIKLQTILNICFVLGHYLVCQKVFLIMFMALQLYPHFSVRNA